MAMSSTFKRMREPGNVLARVANGATSRRKVLDVKMDAARRIARIRYGELTLARQTKSKLSLARDVKTLFTGLDSPNIWRWPALFLGGPQELSIIVAETTAIFRHLTRRAFSRTAVGETARRFSWHSAMRAR